MAKHLVAKDLEKVPNFPITQDTVQPASPQTNHWWVDISVTPHILYRWNGVKWVTIATGSGSSGGGIETELIYQLQEKISVLDSQITVVKNNLDSKVPRTQYDTDRIATTNRIANLEAKTTQHADLISSKVPLVDYQQDKTNITSRLSDVENKNTENTNLLANTVKRDAIIATLNQSAESVKIKGSILDLTAQVTPQDLSTTQLTIGRADGFNTIDKGTLNVPVYLPGSSPSYISDNVEISKRFYRTNSASREDVQQYVINHTARYLKVTVGMYSDAETSASMAVEEEINGIRNVLGTKTSPNTDRNSVDAVKGQVITIDLGIPNGAERIIYVSLRSTTATKYVYGRIVRAWLEG